MQTQFHTFIQWCQSTNIFNFFSSFLFMYSCDEYSHQVWSSFIRISITLPLIGPFTFFTFRKLTIHSNSFLGGLNRMSVLYLHRELWAFSVYCLLLLSYLWVVTYCAFQLKRKLNNRCLHCATPITKFAGPLFSAYYYYFNDQISAAFIVFSLFIYCTTHYATWET